MIVPTITELWTHIMGAGNGVLLFYNQANGQWGTAILRGGSFDVVFSYGPCMRQPRSFVRPRHRS